MEQDAEASLKDRVESLEGRLGSLSRQVTESGGEQGRELEAEAGDAGDAEQAADPLADLWASFEVDDSSEGSGEDQAESAEADETEQRTDALDDLWAGLGLGEQQAAPAVARRSSEEVQGDITDALQRGDIVVAMELFRSERDAVPEASYLEALRLVPEVRGLAGVAEELLNDYLEKGFDASQGCSLALQSVLQVGALRAAVGVFLAGERKGATLPAEQCRGILRVLGSFGQLKPGVAHIRRMRAERGTSEDSELFNALFRGLVLRCSNDSLQLSETLLGAMAEADVRPDGETLGLVLELQMRVGLPGFLTTIGRTLVEFKSRHRVEPGSYAMLVVSAGHLRRGDLEAAYRWFLASRLVEDPIQLGEPEGAQAREYISEMARVFAISGRAQQLLRILRRLSEEGGWLPASASSVSIAGWTSGKTLATTWLEPPAEVLRRRAIWASDPKDDVKVTCAEQFTWPELDSMRHEAYQWSPYLAPDVKPERAWLVPLRAEDTGALGLARDWMGEGPAATAARERLGEQALPGTNAASIAAALDRALKLWPPRPRERVPGAGDPGVGPVVLPMPQSWRVHHADAVLRSFLTASRTRATTKEELVEVLLNDPGTRRLVPNFKPSKPLAFDVNRLEETLEAAPEEAKEELLSISSSVSSRKKEDLSSLLNRLGLTDGTELLKGQLVDLADIAISMLQGDAVLPVPEEEYEDFIRSLSEEELERIWRESAPRGSTDGVLSPELSAAVAEELRRELAEYEEIEGSAADELRLAIDINSELCQLGTWPTGADLRALCAAAHAVNEPELAADLMRTMSDELHSAFAEPIEEEGEQATPTAERPQGPASEALVEAMELGGWEPTSSRAFLAGNRALPERAGGEGLGGLLTRFLDPLMGHARDDPARREQILAELNEPWEGDEAMPAEVAAQVMAADEAELSSKMGEGAEGGEAAPGEEASEVDEGELAALAELAEQSEAAVERGEGAQIWIRNHDGWEVVTEASILGTLLQRPVEEADSMLLDVAPLNRAGDRRRLKALGLPAPTAVSEVRKMMKFAKSVWATASKRRAAYLDAVNVDTLV